MYNSKGPQPKSIINTKERDSPIQKLDKSPNIKRKMSSSAGGIDETQKKKTMSTLAAEAQKFKSSKVNRNILYIFKIEQNDSLMKSVSSNNFKSKNMEKEEDILEEDLEDERSSPALTKKDLERWVLNKTWINKLFQFCNGSWAIQDTFRNTGHRWFWLIGIM